MKKNLGGDCFSFTFSCLSTSLLSAVLHTEAFTFVMFLHLLPVS